MLFALLLLGCGGSASSPEVRNPIPSSIGSDLAVLLPDDALKTDPKILVWADAAWEEGIRISFITDSEFQSLGNLALTKYSGIILPDQVHTKASNSLISALTNYASAGGWLMLVYDFGVLTEMGHFAIPASRLSNLAGIGYMYYDELLDSSVVLSSIAGRRGVMRSLQVPPGKSVVRAPVQYQNKYLSPTKTDPGGLQNYSRVLQAKKMLRQPNFGVSIVDQQENSQNNGMKGDDYSGEISNSDNEALNHTNESTASDNELIVGYGFGVLKYPNIVTDNANNYVGTILLSSEQNKDATIGIKQNAGIASGIHNQGRGGVLFVNIPLSFMKEQQDGMLMHGFLRYFATSVLKQPRLSDHPDGRGGLVFNWHVDSSLALTPMETLDSNKIWETGPFSIHFTAGPDTIQVGDNLGLNVTNNVKSQQWIKYFLSKKHQIGSHGGWDHDLYGANANEDNEDELVPGSTYTFKDFLILNKQAMESVAGRLVTEYSAPEGNNPIWSLNWLQANDCIGYYYTGHTGMGPTRAYCVSPNDPNVSQIITPKMWAFPVCSFGNWATFEEFQINGIPKTEITQWYNDLVDFVISNHTSRLIYAHPPGVVDYIDVLKGLFSRTHSLELKNQFRWYTMTELAQFEARRLQVTWSEKRNGKNCWFKATHPTELKNMTWLLPRAVYSSPVVIDGSAKISSDTENWIVTATGGKALDFSSVRN